MCGVVSIDSRDRRHEENAFQGVEAILHAGPAVSPDDSINGLNGSEVPEIEELVERCMLATGIATRSSSLMDQAKTNARYLYDQYRQIIPKHSLEGFKSHCWKEEFAISWDRKSYQGQIGKNVAFNRNVRDLKRVYQRSFFSPAGNSGFPNNTFRSSLVCLPKVFLAGFYKCGSTYVYCLVNKLISKSLKIPRLHTSLTKEPKFWVLTGNDSNVNLPDTQYLAKYIFYFLPGLREISDHGRHDLVLVDGAPNKMHMQPKFREVEDNVTNYCLLPSVIPQLIPDSKFIVVMREPVSMLYSTFWFSCTTWSIPLSQETKLAAPRIFHDRIMAKVDIFNHCMQDKSIPSISHVCELDSSYSSCILQRLHLTERCVIKASYTNYDHRMPSCGKANLSKSLYFVHVGKWLRVLPKDRFLFMTLEDLAAQNVSQSSRKILSFLDLLTDVTSDEQRLQELTKSCHGREALYKRDPRYHMGEDTKALLKTFFRPFNSLLSDLLGEDLPW